MASQNKQLNKSTNNIENIDSFLVFKRKKHTQILNITSLIDILFLLIIFFTISTTFKNNNAFRIVLPKAKTTTPSSSKQRIIEITITKNGNYYINKNKINEQQISQYIKNLIPKLEDKKAILFIDKNTPYKYIIKIMDILRDQKIFRIKLALLPKS